MKTKHLLFPVFLLGIIVFAACEDDKDFQPEITSEPYTVRLNLGGEVEFSESAIGGRTEGDANFTYYVIQITDVGNGVHASGIFNHIPSDLSVTLFPDRQYDIDVRAVRKGETGGLYLQGNDSTIYWDGAETVTNRLEYNQNLGFSITQSRYIRYYNDDDSSAYSSTSISNTLPNPLNSYFGEASVTDIALEDSVIDLSLTRNVFAYEATVSNLSSGVLITYIAGQVRYFYPGEDSIESKILSYPVVTSDSSYYSRSYTVNVVHEDTISGIPVSNVLYSSSSVPFTRLHRKNIRITMPADTTSGDDDFGFSFEFEDTPLLEGDTLDITG
ncbi:MAG: hypothetical protein NXI20_21870 [bacterium]|nr:hypothetical protein [bacterium]